MTSSDRVGSRSKVGALVSQVDPAKTRFLDDRQFVRQKPMQTSPRIKIILVEDNDLIRQITTSMLARFGFEVITLDGPFGFGRALLKERPSLALVDVSMPGLQGDQLVEVTNQQRAGKICPIVLFSDRTEADLSALAKACGADGFICKSHRWPDIARSINRYIGQHTASLR